MPYLRVMSSFRDAVRSAAIAKDEGALKTILASGTRTSSRSASRSTTSRVRVPRTSPSRSANAGTQTARHSSSLSRLPS
jgi:hypothetical protein